VLYDSPTAGLDPITANNIMSLIVMERDLNNTTTVIVTHRYQDGELLAKYRYDKATNRLRKASGNGSHVDAGTKFMVMREGHLVFEGSQTELESSTDPYVAKFVMRN
jgi:phospholipid/cholesterol/gamma-HCH transport system ATP-binding protein